MKVLRANANGLHLDKANQSDLDEVADYFMPLILDLLDKTPRPTTKLLQEAAMLVWHSATADAKMWAQRIVATIGHCRQKMKSCITGARLRKAVHRIGKKNSRFCQHRKHQRLSSEITSNLQQQGCSRASLQHFAQWALQMLQAARLQRQCSHWARTVTRRAHLRSRSLSQ